MTRITHKSFLFVALVIAGLGGFEVAVTLAQDEPKKAREGGVGPLLEAREALAQRGYEDAFDGLTHTERRGNTLVVTSTPEEVSARSRRLFQAQRDRARNQPERVVVSEAYVKRASDLEKKVRQLSRELMPQKTRLQAEWDLLNAQLVLAQEKGKRTEASDGSGE